MFCHTWRENVAQNRHIGRLGPHLMQGVIFGFKSFFFLLGPWRTCHFNRAGVTKSEISKVKVQCKKWACIFFIVPLFYNPKVTCPCERGHQSHNEKKNDLNRTITAQISWRPSFLKWRLSTALTPPLSAFVWNFFKCLFPGLQQLRFAQIRSQFANFRRTYSNKIWVWSFWKKN